MTKLYGLAEIAQELGLDVKQVRMWKHRGKLPEPTARLTMGHVWHGREIEEWIRQHQTQMAGKS